MTRDVVIPYRETRRQSGDWELRFALRSLDHLDHGRVFFVGDMPSWVQGATRIKFPERDKWWGLHKAFRLLADLDDLTDEVIYTEDDYFVLRPVDDIPNYHLDTLLGHFGRMKNQGSGWAKSLLATQMALQGTVETPMSYELHIPMVVRREEIPVHLDNLTAPLRYKTLYANVSSVPKEPWTAKDVKVKQPTDLPIVLEQDTGFLSSNDNTFIAAGVKAHLDQVLPNPSRYEKDL